MANFMAVIKDARPVENGKMCKLDHQICISQHQARWSCTNNPQTCLEVNNGKCLFHPELPFIR